LASSVGVDTGGDVSAATDQVVLNAVDVRKNYGHVRALDGVDLDLRQAEVHALIGDNGAGKSTLIKVLSGAVHPDSGRIEVNGQEVRFATPRDAQIAGVETVYQDLALASTLDASQNIFLGREIMHRGVWGALGFLNRPDMRRRTEQHLRDLGIALPSVRVPIDILSGGQRQAVAVARAAVWGRRILIMDEPVAALGTHQTGLVLDLIRKARDEKGLSVLFISHNMPQVLAVADRVSVLRLGRRVLTCKGSDATTDMLIAAMSGVSISEDAGATS
jgi:ABC-type sugar transport system ATPase subunit